MGKFMGVAEQFLLMIVGLVLLWNGITGTQSPIYRLVAGTVSYLTRHYQAITALFGFTIAVASGYVFFESID